MRGMRASRRFICATWTHCATAFEADVHAFERFIVPRSICPRFVLPSIARWTYSRFVLLEDWDRVQRRYSGLPLWRQLTRLRPCGRCGELAAGLVTESQPAIRNYFGHDSGNSGDNAQNWQGENQSGAASHGRAEKEHQDAEQRVYVKFATDRERHENKIIEQSHA